MGPYQDLLAIPGGYGAVFTSPVNGSLAVTFTRLGR